MGGIEFYRLSFTLPSLSVSVSGSTDQGVSSFAVSPSSSTSGIQPFVFFVQEAVFLRLEEWKFGRPAERWTLTQYCLEILGSLLESFDLEREPFFEALRLEEEELAEEEEAEDGLGDGLGTEGGLERRNNRRSGVFLPTRDGIPDFPSVGS